MPKKKKVKKAKNLKKVKSAKNIKKVKTKGKPQITASEKKTTNFDAVEKPEIKEAQEAHKNMIPVRITKTKYVSGTYYHEEGWEISAINYPRIETTPLEINNFMGSLAGSLIIRFKQNRICIINPTDVIMVEP